jgi:hypothetical protein
MAMVITGAAALSIWMKETDRCRYARLPKPSVAACVCARALRTGARNTRERERGSANDARAWRRCGGARARHEEAQRADAAQIELGRHALLQLVRLEDVDQRRGRNEREAETETAP